MFTINNDELKLLSLFEQLTGTPARDVISEGESMAFLVPKGLMGRAIGKGGENIERVRSALKKNIFLFEHAEGSEELIRSLFSPVPITHLNIQEKNNEKTAVVKIDSKNRGAAIGRGGERIKLIQALLARHLDMGLKLASV